MFANVTKMRRSIDSGPILALSGLAVLLGACAPTDPAASSGGFGGGIIEIIWLFFLLSSLQPIIQQRYLMGQRIRAMRSMEKKRHTRVITLIHRQEGLALFGIPFARYIDIDDSEQVLRAIELTDPELGLDVIIHTPGGLVLAAEQIAYALQQHPGKVTVFVPHYAMSGGTLIALSSDEIVMSPSAVLGPVDPQLGQTPARSVVNAVETKTDINEVDDQTLILADVSRKALRQVRDFVYGLLEPKMGAGKAGELAEALSQGQWTHDYPILPPEAKALGLPVSTDMPAEVRDLMQLYPQPRNRRPSVEYIPLPYESPGSTPSNGERPGRSRRARMN